MAKEKDKESKKSGSGFFKNVVSPLNVGRPGKDPGPQIDNMISRQSPRDPMGFVPGKSKG